MTDDRPAPGISLWQMAALAALARVAGQGEAERPRGVQESTMRAIERLGLAASRLAERPRSRRFRGRTLPPLLWRVTDRGREVLASGDPAGAARQAVAAALLTAAGRRRGAGGA